MYDSNEAIVAAGPNVSETRYGNLNPKVDFASEPLVSMAPGSRYIRMVGTLNNCGWATTAAQIWFKCSRGLEVDCNSNAPQADKTDWERLACHMIFQGSSEPDGVSLCNDSEVGDFYFIPDSSGDVARLFIKWER